MPAPAAFVLAYHTLELPYHHEAAVFSIGLVGCVCQPVLVVGHICPSRTGPLDARFASAVSVGVCRLWACFRAACIGGVPILSSGGVLTWCQRRRLAAWGRVS